MLDFSFAELAFIVIIAIIFIGPKELPAVVRAVAKAMRSVKSLAAEVHQAFDDLGRESGLKEARSEFEKEMRSTTPRPMIQGDDGSWYETHDITHVMPKPEAPKPEEPKP